MLNLVATPMFIMLMIALKALEELLFVNFGSHLGFQKAVAFNIFWPYLNLPLA